VRSHRELRHFAPARTATARVLEHDPSKNPEAERSSSPAGAAAATWYRAEQECGPGRGATHCSRTTSQAFPFDPRVLCHPFFLSPRAKAPPPTSLLADFLPCDLYTRRAAPWRQRRCGEIDRDRGRVAIGIDRSSNRPASHTRSP